jgi:hypothetical protein
MRVFLAIALILLIGTVQNAVADSLRINNGRYSGGAALVLNLNATQIRTIEDHYRPYMDLPLDDAQQARIRGTSKIQPPPTKLIVVYPADTAGDCTCGLANIGLIFKWDAIEIPVAYLTTDKEAEERAIIE